MSLEYTPLDQISSKVAALKAGFAAGKLADVDSRLDVLRKIYYGFKDSESELKAAIRKDLNKPDGDFQLEELNIFYIDLLEIVKNLKSWVAGEVPSATFAYKFSKMKVVPSPLGTICVIGAFNYPLIIAMQPVIAAISAGNTVLLKMSELVPNVTSTMTSILESVCEPDVLSVINGGVTESSKMLDEKFDKIFFTGSPHVGKIITRKAAETLTPVVLELGGKNPCFVTGGLESQLEVVCQRIAYGKFVNAGQICVTADYLLVHESIYDKFLVQIVESTKRVFGSLGPEKYFKIVNKQAVERLEKIIKSSKGEIIYQDGEIDAEQRFVPPTIISGVSWDDSTMESELFGPIMPIIKYSDLDEIIVKAREKNPTPLSLILFTRSAEEEKKITSRIQSGSVTVNEVVVHVGCNTLPFGGVGNSGQGVYHGKFGFLAFSYERAYFKQPFWLEKILMTKYKSLRAPLDNLTMWLMLPSTPFKRSGKVAVRGHLASASVISLGAVGLVAGLFNRRVEYVAIAAGVALVLLGMS